MMSFGLVRDNTDLLFCNADWHSVSNNQKQTMLEELKAFNSDKLLNTSATDLEDYLVEKYRIDVPHLLTDEITVEQKEIQIDVSGDPSRHIRDRSRPFYLTGTEVVAEIPFEGDKEVFKVQPSSFNLNPPRGKITSEAIIVSISGTNLDEETVKNHINKSVGDIESNLQNLHSVTPAFNEELRKIANAEIEHRRNKLLNDRNLVSNLGFKLKERGDSRRTYTAPEVRRKIAPQPPKASTKPFKPEPALSETEYQKILNIMDHMVEVMERSPSDFEGMGEETIRSHFLVQLNGQYEGQATGETFNKEGKTDIHIRSKERNIFVAECKFWRGAKNHTETIDQLLGYLCWQDTKAAILVFSRNKDFSNVLKEVQTTTLKHAHCKKKLRDRTETSWEYLFSHKDDPNREMKVTIMAFNIPSSSSKPAPNIRRL